MTSQYLRKQLITTSTSVRSLRKGLSRSTIRINVLLICENTNTNTTAVATTTNKSWNMKVTIVPIVIGALGTITKGLLKGLEDLEVGGWVETIQTTALPRMARILRRVLDT